MNQRLALLDHNFGIESYLIMKSADTVEKSKDLLIEAETFGELSSIFIVPNKNINENDFDFNVARNIDIALSQISPRTSLVCLLGNNTDKSVTRLNGMPVYNIKWTSSCSFGEVLKVMDRILDKENMDVTVKNNLKVVLKKKSLQLGTYLSQTKYFNL